MTVAPLLWLEVLVRALAAWTVSYHLALWLHWEFRRILIPFIFLSIIGLLPGAFDRRRSTSPRYAAGWPLLAAAAATGGLAMIVRRPNFDDMEFFHRAFAQGWREPVSVFEKVYGVPVPHLSILHALTSCEYLSACAGHLLGLDSLIVHQSLGAFAASAALVLVLWCSYRWLRLDRTGATAAVLGAVIFLICDGDRHTSLGNMSVVRFWQGKTVLWSLFLPLNNLLLWRFLARPRRSRWFSLFAAGICAVGLSGSSAFLIPFQFASVCAGYWLAHGCNRRALKRAVWGVLGGIYCYVVAALVLSGILGKVPDGWVGEWPSEWWRNLALVIYDPSILARDVLLALAVPFIVCRRPLAALLAFPSLVLAAAAFNPIAGQLLIWLVQPGSYWRLCYVLPVPLCAGLIVAAFVRPPRIAPRRSVAFAGVALFVCALAAKRPVVAASNGVSWKSPLEAQLPSEELAFVERVLPKIKGRRLLAASDELAYVAALRDATLTLETCRSMEFQMGQAGLSREGGEREDSRAFLSASTTHRPKDASRRLGAFLRRTRREVSAIVLAPDQLKRVSAALSADGQRWTEAEVASSYALLLKD